MNNLRHIRKTRTKLTMKQLGELVGVSESAIGYYETGKREPDYEMLLKLGEALGCSVADIMETNRSEAPSPYDEYIEELQILRDNPDTRAVLKTMGNMTAEQVRRMRDFISAMQEE